MIYGRSLFHIIASLIILHSSGATKKGTEKQITSETQKSVQCGTWTKHAEGGVFTSPNYPSKYPPDRECVYIIEAAPRQCIELYFDEKYSIEPSWECKFDHIEVRDGPFGFSPIIGRFCGQQNPPVIKSSGRFLWIKFFADGELESMGFSARYNFTPDPDFKDLGVLKPLPACEFEMGGPEGIVESIQILKEGKASASEAVDCKWYIRAPPRSKIYLRFLDYEMQNSNECKRNFVAVYDGSSSVEDLKAKFCSTVANDVMLRTGLGVIRMWADEGSRNSRFQMLFTSFQERKVPSLGCLSFRSVPGPQGFSAANGVFFMQFGHSKVFLNKWLKPVRFLLPHLDAVRITFAGSVLTSTYASYSCLSRYTLFHWEMVDFVCLQVSSSQEYGGDAVVSDEA